MVNYLTCQTNNTTTYATTSATGTVYDWNGVGTGWTPTMTLSNTTVSRPLALKVVPTYGPQDCGQFDWRVFAEQWAYAGGHYDRGPKPLRCPPTWDGEIELPDGSKLICQNGNYHINDKDAKVVYKATRMREFNRYINASDLLEEFIAFLGMLGVRQSEVLDVPVDVFIHWLIMRAAQQDGEQTDVDPRAHPKLLGTKRWQEKCGVCRRFVSRRVVERGIRACSTEHARILLEAA